MVDRGEVVREHRPSGRCVPGPSSISESPSDSHVRGRPVGCGPLAVEFVERLAQVVAVEPDDLLREPALDSAHTQPLRDVVAAPQRQPVKTEMVPSNGDQLVERGRRIPADGIADQCQMAVDIEIAEHTHQTHLGDPAHEVGTDEMTRRLDPGVVDQANELLDDLGRLVRERRQRRRFGQFPVPTLCRLELVQARTCPRSISRPSTIVATRQNSQVESSAARNRRRWSTVESDHASNGGSDRDHCSVRSASNISRSDSAFSSALISPRPRGR